MSSPRHLCKKFTWSLAQLSIKPSSDTLIWTFIVEIQEIYVRHAGYSVIDISWLGTNRLVTGFLLHEIAKMSWVSNRLPCNTTGSNLYLYKTLEGFIKVAIRCFMKSCKRTQWSGISVPQDQTGRTHSSPMRLQIHLTLMF